LARAKAPEDDDAPPRGSGVGRRGPRPDIVSLEVSDDADPFGWNAELPESIGVLFASRERVDEVAEVALARNAEGPEPARRARRNGPAHEDDGHAGPPRFEEEVRPDLGFDHVDPERRGMVEKRAEDLRQVCGREARRGDLRKLLPRPRESRA